MRPKVFAPRWIVQRVGWNAYYSAARQTGTLAGFLALASFLVLAGGFFAFLTAIFFDISFLLSNQLHPATPSYAAFRAYKVTFPSPTFAI